jgi:3-keto-5-aminohexanoate cleavage enzyme
MSQTAIVMAAPNGARKTHADHANVPVSITATVAEAAQCRAAGASILHAHVRGDADEHVLDSGRYRELIAEMKAQVPDMLVQVTSEAVGRYSPEEQTRVIREVNPDMASMCLREITDGFTRMDLAREFFAWCDDHAVHVQHIVFSREELEQLLACREQGVIPASQRCLMLVLGRYSADQQSSPADLDEFLQLDLSGFDWFTCAFGKREQDCALHAIASGGHARVGFENNLYLPDGELAESSAALVTSLVVSLAEREILPATPAQARQLLGVRSA